MTEARYADKLREVSAALTVLSERRILSEPGSSHLTG
eukprot:COSAG04_NODE_17388_length_470_cov_9.247978_1_plen_36_part_01